MPVLWGVLRQQFCTSAVITVMVCECAQRVLNIWKMLVFTNNTHFSWPPNRPWECRGPRDKQFIDFSLTTEGKQNMLTESCPGRTCGASRRAPGLVGDITEIEGLSIFWDSKELEPKSTWETLTFHSKFWRKFG